jgi:hypothetical protein
MDCKDVVFRGHAIQRMFERGISEVHVLEVTDHGERIKDYLDDNPFPSVLLLGCIDGNAVHVVLGIGPESKICYVITVYHPDPYIWQPDFRGRRK